MTALIMAFAPSEVEYEIAFRSRRADQHACLLGWLQRRPDVTCSPRDHSGDAHVTDAAPAGEPGWHVARLGKVEDAGVIGGPVDGESATGERDRRPGSRRSCGRVRRPARGAIDDARV